MSQAAKNPIKSTKTTFRIIEAIRDLDGAGVTELADHLDLPKSSIHNYLSTLEEIEYLTKRDGTYHVGIRFLELGAYARSKHNLYRIAQPEIDRLAEETGELVNLMVEEHGRGTYIYRAEGSQSVQVDAHIGTQVNLYCTALGKAILAHLPDERVEEILDRHGMAPITDNTITDRDELARELELTRSRGYALDDEERLDGLRCIAVPIKSNTGRVLGALSLSGPTARMTDARLNEELPDVLLQAVNIIELNITYS
jgi:DNA-binding IclR family transcriptional regulator